VSFDKGKASVVDKTRAGRPALGIGKAFVPGPAGVIGKAVAVGALGMGTALSIGAALSTGAMLFVSPVVVTGKVTMAGVMCALLGTARSRAELSDGWQEQNWQPE
jgi:hypothetical protein